MRESPALHDVLLRSDQAHTVCLITFLSWIAHSDEQVSDAEEALLEDIISDASNQPELKIAKECGRVASLQDLYAAAKVCRYLPPDFRKALLELAIAVAVADGFLTVSENQILRFLADVCVIDAKEFKALFYEVTGREYPVPGDPSTIAWWQKRERAQAESAQDSENANRRSEQKNSSSGSNARYPRFTRIEALAVLGLDSNATSEQIVKAYRHLAKTHHPDRFVRLGPEAQRAAEVIFARINHAFEQAKL